ncbi:MAG: acyltransferase [Lachnospiraceae bacterium]|nr:acyltransferase [Lachnospiraceae bacterium]
MLSGYSLMVVGALCSDTIVLRNPISKFISGVSLEIYLAHMMIFRVIQKLGFAAVAGENVTSYILTCAVTICGVLIFASIFQYVEKHLSEKKRNFGNKGESIYGKK